MALPRPSADDLAPIARSLYGGRTDDLNVYAELVAGILEGYDALELVPDSPFPPGPAASREHWPSGANDDPLNAWTVRTLIEGASSGPLLGRRIAMKDSIMVAGVPMSNGTDLLDGFVPDIDATVVTRVLNAGAVIVGKTQCEYFCLSGGSHTSAHGHTHNPHRRGWTAGGSSSGNAAAVVAGDADMALGTDQAGSIRIPASYSGLVGLKPTYGLVPFTGVAPIEPFFDHVGPMTSTVEDNALLLECIAGPDGHDPRQTGRGASDFAAHLPDGASGLRVAVLKEGFGQAGAEADVDAAVLAAAGVFRELGATVDDVSIPLHRLGPVVWLPIAIAGLTETLVRGHGFGSGRGDVYPIELMQRLRARSGDLHSAPPNVKLLILAGTYLDHEHGRQHYGMAVNRVRTLRAAYDRVLAEYDVLLMPTTPQKAQPLPVRDTDVAEWCALAMNMSANTCPFDVTHHPAISIPCGSSDGLPIGLMLVGKHFEEARLYRAAYAYEQA